MNDTDQKITLPLACFVCRLALEPAFGKGGIDGDTHQPWGALMFTAHGNYGSTVYDPLGMGSHECLMINICDSCIVGGAADGTVALATVAPPSPRDTTYTLWTAPEADHDDEE